MNVKCLISELFQDHLWNPPVSLSVFINGSALIVNLATCFSSGNP